MAPKTDLRAYLSGLNSLFRQQKRFFHTMAEARMKEKISAEKGSNLYGVVPGPQDISRWKKVDARNFGIRQSMISQPSWIVLKVLRDKGFEAYLVGGCVRDLILKRTPKDFDVITTAGLKQIKRAFNQAYIIGRRFPICQVNLKGSVIEVSSFKEAATHEEEEAKTHFPKMPKGCSKLDLVRWRDCTRRDFTINSMFYDPFANEIYDYANALMDLKLSKLQTLTPAHMSFTEDCARILRGLRIAARLEFYFSKEIESAIHELSSSINSLNKARLMMELNYMLSYGAAEPSLQLLRRFKLLEFMLPFHDAYLINHSGDRETLSSSMLMKLFSSLDKVATCGQPCDSLLWIGLLAFHLALVNNPQQPLVVWTFSALLYHDNWNKGVKAARQHAFDKVDFEPEILKSFNHLSDEELAQKVSEFATIVQDSINILTDSDSLHDAMAAKYPSSPRSKMALISRRLAGEGAQLFDVLVHDIQSSKNKRESYEINHILLGKGNTVETRFVLGKIIMDTLSGGGVVTDQGNETVNQRSSSPPNGEKILEVIMKRKFNGKERKAGKKPKENTVLQEPADLVSVLSKKQKLIENEDKNLASLFEKKPKVNTVLHEQVDLASVLFKKQKLIQKEDEKLASLFEKKPKVNTGLQELVDLASKPIKKQKLIQKEDKKVASLSEKKSKVNTVLQEQFNLASEPVKKRKLVQKEDKKLASLSEKKSKVNTVIQEQVDPASEPNKKHNLLQKEHKKAMKERKPSQKLSSSFKTKPKKDTAPENKGNEEPVVKEKKNASRLSSLFK